MKTKIFAILLLAVLMIFPLGCRTIGNVQSISGVKMTAMKVQVQSDKLTVEQHNIKERSLRDNKPGSVKFLYIVSPYTGDLILESTVKGKVTSSKKRLSPSDLTEETEGGTAYEKRIEIDGHYYSTNENPSEDGTYGDSIEYLYWFDENNVYHQAYTGAAIIHITDQPMTFYKTTQRIAHEK